MKDAKRYNELVWQEGFERAVAPERIRRTQVTSPVSENDPITAPFYNFGKGSQALYRQPQGQKQMAVSVRCVETGHKNQAGNPS